MALGVLHLYKMIGYDRIADSISAALLKGTKVSLILVIEDDPRIQKALHRQFTTEGYEVYVKGDGAQGLASCKSLKPARVVLDLMMPCMSGLEVCKGIYSLYANTHVHVLIADSEVAVTDYQ